MIRHNASSVQLNQSKCYQWSGREVMFLLYPVINHIISFFFFVPQETALICCYLTYFLSRYMFHLLFVGGDSFLCTSPLISESLSLKSLSPFPLSLPLMWGSLAEIVVNELPFHIVIGLTVSFPYPGSVEYPCRDLNTFMEILSLNTKKTKENKTRKQIRLPFKWTYL